MRIHRRVMSAKQQPLNVHKDDNLVSHKVQWISPYTLHTYIQTYKRTYKSRSGYQRQKISVDISIT